MRKLTLGVLALAASTVIGSAASYAAPFLGYVFENQPGLANDATIAGHPALNTADVTFSTTNINYASPPHAYTIGGFLSDPSTIITGGNSHLGDTLNNTYFFITGFASAPGGTASVVHDDGIQLSRDGSIVINNPLAQQVNTDNAPWVGNHNFQLSYGECCNSPSILHSNLAPAVPAPEPASLALLGAALAGFGVMRRRRKTG